MALTPAMALRPLERQHRRRSLSVSTGLDILLQFAEKSWQAPRADSFDELQELANQSTYNSRQGQALLDRYGSDFDDESGDEDAYDLSDYSEMEQYPSPAPFPRRGGGGRRRVNQIQLEPRKPVDPDEDEDILADIRPKPLSSRRKSATVPPLKIQNSALLHHGMDPEGFPAGGPATPPLTPSTISGLIKGKWNSMSIPQVFKNQKPREYKLQVFVAILFITIMLLVGSIYVIHKGNELRKAYFEQIRFSGKERKIRVVNMKGKEVLSGVLGVSFTPKDKAWPCLTEKMRLNSTCLEWMNKARLYFRKLPSGRDLGSHSPSSIQCYEVFWESLNPAFQLKDCFHITQSRGFYWYGGGEMVANQWPLNISRIPFTPFRTGNKVNLSVTVDGAEDGNVGSGGDAAAAGSGASSTGSVVERVKFEWGRVLSRYFINSPGASIKINADTPLHVSLNEGGNEMLCVGARKAGFPIPADTPDYLNYSICTGDNIRDLARHLTDKDILDGVKHEDVHLTYAITQAPIWKILPGVLSQGNGSESEMSLLNHTDRIADLHFSEGYILLDESWQRRIGDLTMDSERFPTMTETLNITRRRGFKVAITVSPFFSTDSDNYNEGLRKGMWAPQGGQQVPALTKYKQWNSVALLDASRKSAQDWVVGKMKEIGAKYGIDAVYLDLGTAEDFPQFATFSADLKSLDYLGKYFIRAVRRVNSLTTIGVSSAVQLPKLPTFIGMSPTESSWSGIQSLIPNILSLGSSGYPYVMPGSIGGDFGSMERPPERNLYLRWLELAHFFPVVQYSYLPSDYDPVVVETAYTMNIIRKSKLLPYIKKAIDESMTSGLPIIRPLWMLDPQDPNCLRISDEFLIGNDILVAPILRFNTTERDIYLPRGRWRDEKDGSNTKGEKTLHHYRAAETQIPFFTRIQE